jgi:hypothetical protein
MREDAGSLAYFTLLLFCLMVMLLAGATGTVHVGVDVGLPPPLFSAAYAVPRAASSAARPLAMSLVCVFIVISFSVGFESNRQPALPDSRY